MSKKYQMLQIMKLMKTETTVAAIRAQHMQKGLLHWKRRYCGMNVKVNVTQQNYFCWRGWGITLQKNKDLHFDKEKSAISSSNKVQFYDIVITIIFLYVQFSILILQYSTDTFVQYVLYFKHTDILKFSYPNNWISELYLVPISSDKRRPTVFELSTVTLNFCITNYIQTHSSFFHFALTFRRNLGKSLKVTRNVQKVEIYVSIYLWATMAFHNFYCCFEIFRSLLISKSANISM